MAARKSFASRAGSVSLRLEPANEPNHTRAHSLLSGKHEPLLVRSSSALAATYLPACLPTSSTVRAAVSQRTTSAPQRSGAAAVTTYLPTYLPTRGPPVGAHRNRHHHVRVRAVCLAGVFNQSAAQVRTTAPTHSRATPRLSESDAQRKQSVSATCSTQHARHA